MIRGVVAGGFLLIFGLMAFYAIIFQPFRDPQTVSMKDFRMSDKEVSKNWIQIPGSGESRVSWTVSLASVSHYFPIPL